MSYHRDLAISINLILPALATFVSIQPVNFER